MKHAADSGGVPVWVAIVVPLITAMLGLLGGGIVRFLLDRRQAMARAAGYARVVREELLNVLERLDPELPGLMLLPTNAWTQHSTELAAALLPDEFSALTRVYRAITSANWDVQAIAPPPGASFPPTITAEIRDERAQLTAIVRSLGLPSIEWLAISPPPFWRQRRVRHVMTPSPYTRCRCGHQWANHRWAWATRGWWRIRWRGYEARSVAYECNVEGCSCHWFRAPGERHLPRWIQTLGPGRQAPPHETEPAPEPVDSSIPPTAQRGAVVPAAVDASESHEDS